MISPKPELQLPFRLPWDAMARIMTAYAEECRAVTKRRGHPKADGWRREAKRAERAAKTYRALHELDRREPYPWPRDEPFAW